MLKLLHAAAQHGVDPAPGHGGGIRSRYPTRLPCPRFCTHKPICWSHSRESKALLSRARPRRVWDARQQQFASGFGLQSARCFLRKLRAFAERVRSLGGESVTQATGIMTAGFPAAAAEHLPQLRRELEAASGSLMVLKQPAESEARLLGNPTRQPSPDAGDQAQVRSRRCS